MAPSIEWAAGLFEGEGCITIVRNSKARLKLHAKICLQMNDEEIVEKFASVFPGCGKVYNRPPRATSKASFMWNCYSRKDVRFVISQLYPHLGVRRQLKCVEALELMDRQDGV